MKINDSYLARRRFLCGMVGSGAAVLGVGAGLPLVPYVANLQEEPLPEWIEIDEAECELAPGTAKKVMYGPVTALLIQTPGANSALRVFLATCTHLDCPVGYDAAENQIVCPCHQGFYRVDGTVISGPPSKPLREFHYRVHDGRLIIALEKENIEKALGDT